MASLSSYWGRCHRLLGSFARVYYTTIVLGSIGVITVMFFVGGIEVGLRFALGALLLGSGLALLPFLKYLDMRQKRYKRLRRVHSRRTRSPLSDLPR